MQYKMQGDNMLSSDEIIKKILQEEKEVGNRILEPFNIQYPNQRLAEESNNIFIATVSSENQQDGFEFSTFNDLVEIYVITKQLDYEKATILIKAVCLEICKLIIKNRDKFPTKPVIRNINPEFNRDYVLNRGRIMVQVLTEPVTFDLTDEEYNICSVILNEIKER